MVYDFARKGEVFIKMPNNFGPNSTKVANYLDLLSTITVDSVNSVSLSDWSMGELRKVIDEFSLLKSNRSLEQTLAGQDAEKCLPAYVPHHLSTIFVFLAQWFVVEDLICEDARTFMSLYFIAQLFDGVALHRNYRNEDWAIRGFCDRLSEIDGQLVSIDLDLD